ncbi:lipocalin-like domain-containing protein [Streptomyces lunalinharesii]|uniref:Lipocalin-like domain-containing protein n=1 Tax=Streptomyces lunalinharesii TaxID=333384 RepID=A0ABN3S3M9_9ACTN
MSGTEKSPVPQPDWDAGLVGTWRLRSIRELGADGAVLDEPYGQQPPGRLHYGPAHQVAVVIPGHADAPAVAYLGEYEADAAGKVLHNVHVGLPPFTEDQVRWAQLEGDSLALATDIEGQHRTELRWTRT